MNRSFRAPEKEAVGLVKQRQQQQLITGSYRNSALREKEDEPGLFVEMKNREKERHDLLLQNAESEFDSSIGSRTGESPIFSMPSATFVRKNVADEFLNSENDKNDYDWLMTPPGTPLFPSLEMQSQKTVMNQNGTFKDHQIAVKSRLSNGQLETAGRNNLASKARAASPGLSRRPSSTGATGSGLKSSTLTSRPALGTQARDVSSLVTKNKPTTTTTTRPRSSTPTSRPVVSSSTPTVPARSSTPTTRSTARSSTPTSRPSLSTIKPAPRAATPPRRSPTLSTSPKTSTVTNSASSPSARPRPWKPQEMPGYTLDAPPNLRTSLTDRPISSIRGRAGAPSSRSSSVEPVPAGRVRRQSCSPSRGRLPNGVNRKSGNSVPIPALARAYAKANDSMSPGLYGTQMVERVVNMRKLVPPKHDDKHSPNSNLSGKSSSPDSLGFGRSLSKKSLDMAMRHMDIRRSIPGNLRPLMTKIPASSMYSVRSGPTRSRTINVSESLPATSSNASSDMSVNNNNNPIDEHLDDESNSEKGVRSPASIRGR